MFINKNTKIYFRFTTKLAVAFMSHKNPIRTDKTCLNCNHVVEKRFCSNCGQENTDTRKTFHHLFIHFFEDLTHYENAFWKTIRNLVLRPASLTKEYLSGKRMSYLAPVRLYIFISFVTFFLLTVFPNEGQDIVIKEKNKTEKKVENSTKKERQINELLKKGKISKAESDSIKKIIAKNNAKEDNFVNIGYKSLKELDSVQKYGKEEDKLTDFEYWISKKIVIVQQKNTKEELLKKMEESLLHNFPKVLLIYMPLFAFFLWLFHNKKRWYYFDHGIFTLHYFSFLLLTILVEFIIGKVVAIFDNNTIVNVLDVIVGIVLFGWMLYYFFPAHHRFYGETRWVSLIKSLFLFFINLFFITIILVIYFIYTLINLH